jgi:hypothetical protein
VIAADAGLMQIQWWEGAALSFAQTVQQDTTQDLDLYIQTYRELSDGQGI